MFKKVLNLICNRAGWNRWKLEIGAYLLKSGTDYEIGQILKSKPLGKGKYKVKVVSGLFYDFGENKVNHTKENRVVRTKDIKGK